MAGNPYSSHPTSTSKRSGSNKGIWIALAGIVVALPLLCCGGIALIGYFGLDVLAADIEMQLRDHPVVQEHIGQIERTVG